MLAKRALLGALLMAWLSASGCCRWCDRCCGGRQAAAPVACAPVQNYAAPAACVPCVPCCPTGSSPVNWQRPALPPPPPQYCP